MKTLTQLLQRAAALAILVLFTQLLPDDLNLLSLKFMGIVHSSALNPIFRLLTKIFSFGILNFIIAMFFIHNVIMKPRFVRNIDFAMFYFLSVAINSYFGILFTELSPFMRAIIINDADVTIYDCDTDFGMPSSHLFMVTAVYYMYKVRYFEKRKTIDQDPHDPSNQVPESDDITQIIAHNPRLKVIGPNDMSYIQFTIISMMYIGATALCRYMAASNFILQLAVGFCLSLLWSYVYFTYLSKPLQLLIYGLFISNQSAIQPLIFVNRSISLMLAMLIVLASIRSFFVNQNETDKLEQKIASSCNGYFSYGVQNIYESLGALIPLIMINMFTLNNASARYDKLITITYFDLHRGDKMIRSALFTISIIIIYLFKWGFNYIVHEMTGNKHYGIIHIAFHVLCCMILAYYYGNLLPLILLNNDILIQGDVPFTSSRESMAMRVDLKDYRNSDNYANERASDDIVEAGDKTVI